MMASRSLTDIFILMRNNTVHRRVILQEQNPIDSTETDGNPNQESPPWINSYSYAENQLSLLQEQIEALNNLQLKNLHRPSFDDSSDEEHQIEHLRHEITVILSSIHRVIQTIKSQTHLGSTREQRLKQNIIRKLAIYLQEHTSKFRSCQNSYLERIKSREQRLNFFDLSNVNLELPKEEKRKERVKPVIKLNKDKNFFDDDDDVIEDVNDEEFMLGAVKKNFNENKIQMNATNTFNQSDMPKEILTESVRQPETKPPQTILNKFKHINKEDCKIS